MGRFASTVAYYESARPPYGAAFFARSPRAWPRSKPASSRRRRWARHFGDRLCALLPGGRGRRSRAGHGRGGARRGRARGRRGDVHRGPVRGAAAKLGAFDIVTIGRAIHWLDPEPARAALDRALAPRGRVLVCGATSAKDGRNPWLETFNAVRDRWKGDRPSRDHQTFFAGGQFTGAGPSGSSGPTPFQSSAWSNACCRCRLLRQSGLATKSPR